MRRRSTSFIAFAAYLALSLLFFGARVVLHPSRSYVGSHLGRDPQNFIWSFAWWAHALTHGENPFYSHAVWAPEGANLAWTTSVPALSLVFVPVTLAAGAIASYNLACILMPALAAWTAFALCRHLTRATWPSLAGGYLFGFSAYVVGAEQQHLHMAAVFVLPLVALLALRYVEGSLDGKGLVVRLGPLLALQVGLSTEVLFTMTLALACALALAFVLVPNARGRLRSFVVPLAASFCFAAVLAAPFIWYLVRGFGGTEIQSSTSFVADVANIVVPGDPQLVGSWWAHDVARHFPGNDAERGAYLGLPAVVIIGWFAWRRLRDPGAHFILSAVALAELCALGNWLTIAGHRLVTLPWIHIGYLPLLKHVLPTRLSVFSALAAAVVVALWAASSPKPAWLGTLLPVLAVCAIVPNFTINTWSVTPPVPSFFTADRYLQCLRPGETVLALPFGSHADSLLWQVESGFWFRMAGGYVSLTPKSYLHPTAIAHLTTEDRVKDVTPEAVRLFTKLKGVDSIVVDGRMARQWSRTLNGFHGPWRIGGVALYRVTGAPPGAACLA